MLYEYNALGRSNGHDLPALLKVAVNSLEIDPICLSTERLEWWKGETAIVLIVRAS